MGNIRYVIVGASFEICANHSQTPPISYSAMLKDCHMKMEKAHANNYFYTSTLCFVCFSLTLPKVDYNLLNK